MAAVNPFEQIHFSNYLQGQQQKNIAVVSRYGNQNMYRIGAVEACNKGYEWLKNAGRVKGIFQGLLHQLQQARKTLAETMGSEHCEMFGKPRQDSLGMCHTGLFYPYDQQGEKCRAFLARHLEKVSIPVSGPVQPSTVISPKIDPQARFSYQVQILSAKDYQKKVESATTVWEQFVKEKRVVEKDIPDVEVHEFARQYPEEMSYRSVLLLTNQLDFSSYIKQKETQHAQKHPALYLFNGFKHVFCITKIFVRVLGKPTPLGEIVTWSYRDGSRPPHTILAQEGRSYVVHQHSCHMQDTMTEIEDIFQRILQWKQEDPFETLQEQIAQLRYYFAFLMPSFRGDGAIGDWIEAICYYNHGYGVNFHDTSLQCMEPFAHFHFPNYLKCYRKTRTFLHQGQEVEQKVS